MFKTRNFAFTLHHDEHIDQQILIDAIKSIAACSFIQFQLEEAPTTGRLHFQGMACFSHPISSTRLINVIEDATACHPAVERAISVPHLLTYTSKADTRLDGPWRWGSLPGREPANPGFGGGVPPQGGGRGGGGQGTRTDLIAFRDAIIAGKSDIDLYMEYPSEMFKYPLMPARLRATFAPKRDWVPEVHVYFGAAGTGKSRRAHELAPGAYRKVSGLWWDLYQGESDVIMDDFYGVGHMDYTEFLKFTDRYDYMAQVKGAMIRVNPKRIFITSNSHPEQWYCADKNFNSSAFFRRFTTIIRFNADGTTTDLSEIVLE